MVDWLEKRSFAIFGYYRLAIGVAAATLISTGYF
jgi:undecaprenyl pyrophosphate phosphatase UppP